MQYLRQSTSLTMKAGPFVDSTDGDTDESALTISQGDVLLSKDNGDWAQKNNASAATYTSQGFYDVPFSTSDTGTLGPWKADIHVTGALHVWIYGMVIPAQLYDTWFGSDRQQVDVREMGANVMTAAAMATDMVTEITDAILALDLFKRLGAMVHGKWSFDTSTKILTVYEENDDSTALFTYDYSTNNQRTSGTP